MDCTHGSFQGEAGCSFFVLLFRGYTRATIFATYQENSGHLGEKCHAKSILWVYFKIFKLLINKYISLSQGYIR